MDCVAIIVIPATILNVRNPLISKFGFRATAWHEFTMSFVVFGVLAHTLWILMRWTEPVPSWSMFGRGGFMLCQFWLLEFLLLTVLFVLASAAALAMKMESTQTRRRMLWEKNCHEAISQVRSRAALR